MKISLIVPAFNEEKCIARSLRKIRAASDAFVSLGWDSEIIVCDNNSTDRTAEKARAAGATVVFEPVNQISRARNRGRGRRHGRLAGVRGCRFLSEPGAVGGPGKCRRKRPMPRRRCSGQNGPGGRMDEAVYTRLECDQPDATLGGRFVCFL